MEKQDEKSTFTNNLFVSGGLPNEFFNAVSKYRVVPGAFVVWCLKIE